MTADPALTRETTQLMRAPDTVSLGPYIVLPGPYTLLWELGIVPKNSFFTGSLIKEMAKRLKYFCQI